jgi:tetratricopeptide (TPR) repeat protein
MPDVNEQLANALTLHRDGRLDEAAALYRAILDGAPAHADARHLLGLIRDQQGDRAGALADIDAAIALADDVAMYHANRSRVLTALDRHNDALASAERALALELHNAETLSDLAGALLRLDRAPEALAAAERALQLAPTLDAARRNLALARFEVGFLVQEAGDLDTAEALYRGALELDPERVEALVNLGNVFRLRYRVADAALCYEAALAKGCVLPEVFGNLGVIRQEMGDTAAALANYDRALAAEPNNPEIRRNRAQAMLKQGRFEEGWREFEWRWQTAHFSHFRRDWEKPRWTGQPVHGETVIVHAEQGFGDSLQFARYLPMVAERGARVVVECPRPLMSLLANVDGVAEVFEYGAAMPEHDYQIPMMSLPGEFATDLANLPAEVPYLGPSDATRAKWRERIGIGDGRRVGLVWKGSANHQRNDWRSPGLAAFRPLMELEGITWFSLQKDDEVADLASIGLTDRITALGGGFEDFADTAAAIECLDLVISPDTAVAHLAGALARPVWLVLPFASEWRWFEDRSDSPWYPTMRLFRQAAYGDWNSAVQAMAIALNGA